MKLIYGKESYLINKEIKRIVKSFKGDEIVFDDKFTIEEIINEIVTIGLFNDRKIIVIKDDRFLKEKNQIDRLIKVLDTKEKSVQVIFAFYKEKIDLKNQLLSFVSKKGQVKKMDEIKQSKLPSLIEEIVTHKNGSIEKMAAINLAKLLPNNLYIIIQEIEKLLINSPKITNELVLSCIENYDQEGAFELVNAIVDQDKILLMENLNKKTRDNIASVTIIAQIVNTLSLTRIVKSYLDSSYSQIQIAEKLKVHPFRIKKSAELINNLEEETLDHLFDKLLTIDKKIKTGKINEEIAKSLLITSLLS